MRRALHSSHVLDKPRRVARWTAHTHTHRMSSRWRCGGDDKKGGEQGGEQGGGRVDIGRFLFANLEQRVLDGRRAAKERQPAATSWSLAALPPSTSMYQGTIFTMASLDGKALQALADFSMDVDLVYYARDARHMAASGEGDESDNDKLVRFGELYPNKTLKAIELADLAALTMSDNIPLHKTLVHLEGGQTFVNEEIIRKTNGTKERSLFPNLDRLIAKGVRFVGQSAGAITLGMYNTAAFKGDEGDWPAWTAEIIKGHEVPVKQAPMLGLIDACMVPHYRSEKHREVGKEIALLFNVDTYGIPNGGYAIFEHKASRPFEVGVGVTLFKSRAPRGVAGGRHKE